MVPKNFAFTWVLKFVGSGVLPIYSYSNDADVEGIKINWHQQSQRFLSDRNMQSARPMATMKLFYAFFWLYPNNIVTPRSMS